MIRNTHLALANLESGLFFLRDSVAAIEFKVDQFQRSSGCRRDILTLFDAENHAPMLGLEPRELALIEPAFAWFTVSICSYIRLQGFMKAEQDREFDWLESTPQPTSSQKQMLKARCASSLKDVEEVETLRRWRGKVYAHFALVDPYKEDDLAMMAFSIMPQVGYSNGRFRVGTTRVLQLGGESALPEWSLTEMSERIAPLLGWNEGERTVD
ncbi:MAG: hypothetical protein WCK51_12565 [Armatimonadota bacterium]